MNYFCAPRNKSTFVNCDFWIDHLITIRKKKLSIALIIMYRGLVGTILMCPENHQPEKIETKFQGT